MAKLKRFMLYHGEKVIVLLLGALCLWSMAGMVFRDRSMLPVSDGDPYKVDREKIDKQINKITGRLNSGKVVVSAELEKVEPLVSTVRSEFERKDVKLAKIDGVNLFYGRPPRPTSVTIITPPPPVYRDPPPAIITAVAEPTDCKVIVGRESILVICRTSDKNVYPEGNEVSVRLECKDVGPGREDLKPEVRKSVMQSVYGGVAVDAGVDDNKTEDKAADDPWGEFMGEGEATGREAAPDTAAVEGDLVTEYFNRKLQTEIASYNLTKKISNINNLPKTPWIVLTEKMQGFDEEFTEEQIAEILKTGELPVNGGGVKTTAPKKNGQKTGGNRIDVPAMPVPERPKAPEMPVAPGTDPAVKTAPIVPGTADANIVENIVEEVVPYRPKFYAFIHKTGVQENNIYRYRMVAYAKCRMVPQEILDFKLNDTAIYKSYVHRVELGDMRQIVKAQLPNAGEVSLTTGMLAIPHWKFMEFASSQRAFQGPFTKNNQPAWGPSVAAIKRDSKGHVQGLLGEDNMPNRLGAAYIRRDDAGYCYSFYTYTGVVMTPILKRMELVSLGDNEVSMRVFVVAEDGKEIRQPRAMLYKIPQEVSSLTWKDYIKTAPSTKNPQNEVIVWGDDGHPEVIGMDKYYAKAGNFAPVMIGMKEKVRDKEVDFSTDWELVDVKKCTFRFTLFKKDEDGAFKVVRSTERPLRPYVVLRNVKSKRFKLLLRRQATPPTAKDESEFWKTEIIWNPELEAKLDELKEKRLKLLNKDKALEGENKAGEAEPAENE